MGGRQIVIGQELSVHWYSWRSSGGELDGVQASIIETSHLYNIAKSVPTLKMVKNDKKYR